jgi:hypothetical protein
VGVVAGPTRKRVCSRGVNRQDVCGMGDRIQLWTFSSLVCPRPPPNVSSLNSHPNFPKLYQVLCRIRAVVFDLELRTSQSPTPATGGAARRRRSRSLKRARRSAAAGDECGLHPSYRRSAPCWPSVFGLSGCTFPLVSLFSFSSCCWNRTAIRPRRARRS